MANKDRMLFHYECPFDWDINWMNEASSERMHVVSDEALSSRDTSEHVQRYAVYERFLAALRRSTSSFSLCDYETSKACVMKLEEQLERRGKFIEDYNEALTSLICMCKVRLMEIDQDYSKINEVLEKAVLLDEMSDKMKSAVYLLKGACYGIPVDNSQNEGLEYIRKAIELNPEDPIHKYVAAKLMSQIRFSQYSSNILDDAKLEIALLENAIETGDFYFAYPNLCSVYRMTGQAGQSRIVGYLKKAREIAERAIQLKEIKTHPTLLARCADCLFCLGEFRNRELANELFLSAVNLTPTSAMACVLGAKCFILQGDYETAQWMAKKGAKEFNNFAAKMYDLLINTVLRKDFDIDAEYGQFIENYVTGNTYLRTVEITFSIMNLFRKNLKRSVEHFMKAIEQNVPLRKIQFFMAIGLLTTTNVGYLILNEISIALYQENKIYFERRYDIQKSDITWFNEKLSVIAKYTDITLPIKIKYDLLEKKQWKV